MQTLITKAPMTLRPYSAVPLLIGGAIAMALGLYFIFLRPPVLPEVATSRLRGQGRRWQQLPGNARASRWREPQRSAETPGQAIGLAWSDDVFIDEVNDGYSDLL